MLSLFRLIVECFSWGLVGHHMSRHVRNDMTWSTSTSSQRKCTSLELCHSSPLHLCIWKNSPVTQPHKSMQPYAQVCAHEPLSIVTMFSHPCHVAIVAPCLSSPRVSPHYISPFALVVSPPFHICLFFRLSHLYFERKSLIWGNSLALHLIVYY